MPVGVGRAERPTPTVTISLCFQSDRLYFLLLALPLLSQIGYCEQRHGPDSHQDEEEFESIERAGSVRRSISEVPEERQGEMEDAHHRLILVV